MYSLNPIFIQQELLKPPSKVQAPWEVQQESPLEPVLKDLGPKSGVGCVYSFSIL